MKRPISLTYAGMHVSGTVETPDGTEARRFVRSAERVRALALLTSDPVPRVFGNWGWREIAAEPEPIDGILG